MFTYTMGFLQEMGYTPDYEANKDFAGSATTTVCVDVQKTLLQQVFFRLRTMPLRTKIADCREEAFTVWCHQLSPVFR